MACLPRAARQLNINVSGARCPACTSEHRKPLAMDIRWARLGIKAMSQAVQYLLGKPAVCLPTLRTPDPKLGASAEAFILQRDPIRGGTDGGAICATQGFGGYDGAIALKGANADSLSRYSVDPHVLAAYLERWPQLRAEREQRERSWRRRRGAALELAQAHCWHGWSDDADRDCPQWTVPICVMGSVLERSCIEHLCESFEFVLHELVGDQGLSDLPHFADYSAELADSILEQAAKFAEEVLEPINRAGDLKGAQWTAEGVKMPPNSNRPTPNSPPMVGLSLRQQANTAAKAHRRFWVLQSRSCGRPRTCRSSCAHAHARRGGSARTVRLAGAEENVSAQDGERRVDRNDGAHRAARGLGSRPIRTRAVPKAITTGCSARRSSSPGVITTALTTSSTWCWRASTARHRARRAFRCSSCPSTGERRRLSRRAQRSALCLHRAQARNSREPHVHARVRRPRARSATSSASRTAASNTCSS